MSVTIGNPGAERAARFAELMMSLDRCEHGRHFADSCFDCPGGESIGNQLIQPGQLIGHAVRGEEIRVPDWSKKNDPMAWIARRAPQ